MRPRSLFRAAPVQCPGLKITSNAGVSFTDSLSRVHDLEREPVLRPKQAAADPRMCGLTVRDITRAIRQGRLYPVLRLNRKVILIFDCALTDWRTRTLAAAQPAMVDRLRGLLRAS